jgi:hypothetical protein
MSDPQEDHLLSFSDDQYQFLGEEFFLWLWHWSDENGRLFQVSDGTIELEINNLIELAAELSTAEQSRLKGGSPAYSGEAMKALSNGKHVVKARFVLKRDERAWTFMASSKDLTVSAIKIPSVINKDEELAFEERMYLIEELDDLWLQLYRSFLIERVGTVWARKETELRDWILEGAKKN